MSPLERREADLRRGGVRLQDVLLTIAGILLFAGSCMGFHP